VRGRRARRSAQPCAQRRDDDKTPEPHRTRARIPVPR
jgi:hypothetical protein